MIDDVYFFFLKATWGTLSITALAFIIGFSLLWVISYFCSENLKLFRFTLKASRVLQSIPFLILLFWIHFAGGYCLKYFNVFITPFLSGVLALSVSFLIYATEVVLVAHDELRRGVLLSADALFIRGWRRYVYISFPLLWIRFKGAIANLLLMLMKESALVSALGYFELTRSAHVYSEFTSQYFNGILYVLLIYWVLGILLERGFVYKNILSRNS